VGKVAKLEKERGICYTVGGLARMFNVSAFVAGNWIKAGKPAYYTRIEGERIGKYFISAKKAEQFRERLLEERK
jgi:hypothetical protein